MKQFSSVQSLLSPCHFERFYSSMPMKSSEKNEITDHLMSLEASCFHSFPPERQFQDFCHVTAVITDHTMFFVQSGKKHLQNLSSFLGSKVQSQTCKVINSNGEEK